MVAPLLLGLLAAGGIDQYNKVSDRQDRRALGREFEQALSGNLLDTPRGRAEALGRAGLIDGSEFMRTDMGQYGYGQQQDMLGQRLSHDQAQQGRRFAHENARDKAAQQFQLQEQHRQNQAAYIGAVEPYMASQQRVGEALRVFDDTSWGPDMLQDDNTLRATAVVNQAIMEARANYWTGALGRSDAPSEQEAEELRELFPTIEGPIDSRKARATLERAQAQNAAMIQRERVRFAGNATGNPGAVLDSYGPGGVSATDSGYFTAD